MSENLHTDEEIALLVKAGDKEIFGVLVERFEPKLLRYGNKFLARTEDVEDIVQDVFIKVYQNIKSFNPSQKFSSWIYRIAHNCFVNALKKNSLNPLTLFDFDILVSHTAYDDPAGDEREQKEMRTMIDRGLNQLSPKYREILILYYLEEMPYKEIADILQVPAGTVGIRIKRAKVELKKLLEPIHHEQ
ncbi:MAG: RNA polymerase sigma factor [Patescibacteria group bacterium]